jgi:NADPH-dependent curcumin reductase CurA
VVAVSYLTPDYAGHYPEARAELAGWLREGRLISPEDVRTGGVRAFPETLLKIDSGVGRQASRAIRRASMTG